MMYSYFKNLQFWNNVQTLHTDCVQIFTIVKMDPRQISLLKLVEFNRINFHFPSNHQGFLMTSKGIKVKEVF